MKSQIVMAALLTAMGCLSCIGLQHTGHLIVRVTDRNGEPITNATVKVRNLLCTGIGAGAYESHYGKTSAMTDTNGVVDVAFPFVYDDFEWSLYTPSHYSSSDYSYKRESFGVTIVPSDYLHFETNTVDGLAKYNELKALEEAGDYVTYMSKFEPKSVTFHTNIICREATGFYPKHNPQPMYSHHDSDCLKRLILPYNVSSITTNDDVEIIHYPTVDYDMRQNHLLQPWDYWKYPQPGEMSDFKLFRTQFTTNGVTMRSGWIEFAPGCGAYKGVKPRDGSFNGFYEADTNAVFVSRIPFEQREVECGWEDTLPILTESEYLVIRTRAMMDDSGAVTNCHYAAIIGEMPGPLSNLNFYRVIFNPRPNDPNLECDYSRKLKP